jgi:hypothetical protein
MKKSMVLVFVAVSVLASAQPLTSKAKLPAIQDIVGSWEIIGTKNEGSLDIQDEYSVIVNYRGERRSISDFSMDFSKSPIWFDFTVRDSSGSMVIKSIMEIISPDLIKWQVFIDEERSPHFTAERGELFYLKRLRIKTLATFAH